MQADAAPLHAAKTAAHHRPLRRRSHPFYQLHSSGTHISPCSHPTVAFARFLDITGRCWLRLFIDFDQLSPALSIHWTSAATTKTTCNQPRPTYRNRTCRRHSTSAEGLFGLYGGSSSGHTLRRSHERQYLPLMDFVVACTNKCN